MRADHLIDHRVEPLDYSRKIDFVPQALVESLHSD